MSKNGWENLKKITFVSVNVVSLLFLHLYLLEPDSMDETGLGQAGIGEAAVLGPKLAAPWVNCTEG